MTPTRDAKGRFVKGCSGNPNGRKPHATEQEYREAIKDVIPLERFIRQLERLALRADKGDSRAFDKICGLLGLNIIKNEGEHDVAVTIRVVDETSE